MLGIGLGVDWAGNKTSGNSPEIFTLQFYECLGVPVTVYSLSSAFAVGIFIYQDNLLQNPYNGALNNDQVDTIKNLVTNGLVTEFTIACD